MTIQPVAEISIELRRHHHTQRQPQYRAEPKQRHHHAKGSGWPDREDHAEDDLADLGIGVTGIKSVTGHKSTGMALYYVRLADQKRQNALAVEAWNAALDAKEKLKAGGG